MSEQRGAGLLPEGSRRQDSLESGNHAASPTRPPGRGLPWILLTSLLLAIDYSMIMPTGYQYITEMGGSELFYSATIGAFPIGRCCFLIVFGKWSDLAGFRGPFLAANCLMVAGGLLYGSASALGSPWFALLGRFISGCGATHPLSAWAARMYPPAKRTEIETTQKSAQLMGVVFGPALNIFVANLDSNLGPLQLNARTCAGYFPAILTFMLLVAYLTGVDEPPALDNASDRHETAPCQRLVTTGIWVCMYMSFITNCQISALDVVAAPLMTKQLGWDLTQNSLLFAGLAGLSFIGAVIAIVAIRCKVDTVTLIQVSKLVTMLSSVAFSVSLWKAPDTINLPLLFASACVAVISLLSAAGPTGGLFQQACGDAQGFLGGMYTLTFALGRPVGAFLGGELLSGSPEIMCIIFPFALALANLFLGVLRGRLQRAERAELAKGRERSTSTSSFGEFAA